MTMRSPISSDVSEAAESRHAFDVRKRIAAKLASTAGDTLAEVLTALLVTVMAVMLMATMLMAATNVTSKNETKMTELFADQSSLSVQDGSVMPEMGVVTIEGDASGYSETFKGNFYITDGFVRYEPTFNRGGYK